MTCGSINRVGGRDDLCESHGVRSHLGPVCKNEEIKSEWSSKFIDLDLST